MLRGRGSLWFPVGFANEMLESNIGVHQRKRENGERHRLLVNPLSFQGCLFIIVNQVCYPCGVTIDKKRVSTSDISVVFVQG